VIAFLLAIAILVFLGLVGLGAMVLFDRRVPLGLLLLSPAIGIGVVLPLELTLNRAGLPVEVFGPWLVFGLTVLAAAALTLRRPVVPWNELRPLLPAYACGGFLAGAPMFAFGLHWAGNGNGDMAVYVSNAAAFLHHGFFDVAPISELIRGLDTARNLWFWEVGPPNRYGTDALLALIAAAARVTTYETYMPLSVAAFLAMAIATSALCANTIMRGRMVITAWVISVASPLMLFTVYQQTLPQLLGQVALVGIVAAVQMGEPKKLSVLQQAAAIGSCCVALSLVYPEISPLLMAGAAVTIPVALWLHRKEIRSYAFRIGLVIAIAVVVAILLENVQLFTLAATLYTLETIIGHSVNEGPGVITYYLLPSWVANFWGLTPFESYVEPWLSSAIVVGALGFLAVAVVGIRSLLKYGKLSDGMLVALQFELLFLMYNRSGYAAFKAGFILQPFLAPAVAALILWLAGKTGRFLNRNAHFAPAALTAVFVAGTLYTTYTYLAATSDAFTHTRAEFVEINGASSGNFYGSLDGIGARYRRQLSLPIRVDGLVYQVDLLAGIALRGHPLQFENGDPFVQYFTGNTGSLVGNIPGWPAGTRELTQSNADLRARVFAQPDLLVDGRYRKIYVASNPFDQNHFSTSGDGLFLEIGPYLSVLNNSQLRVPFHVRVVPWAGVRNWLCLVDSDFGTPTTLHHNFVAAMGETEPDPANPPNFMTTLGKSMLLEVVNGPPTVRLELALTATFNPRPHTQIPPIVIVGESRVTVPSPGSGSARILTPPVRPLNAFGRRYLVLYFGKQLVKFPQIRSGLMNLYGRDIDLDPRRFVLFGRNISVGGQLPSAPRRISRFPHDLMNPGLLYSGIFEDGWLSAKFSARLRSSSPKDVLHVRINVPPVSPKQTIFVSIDGRDAGQFVSTPSHYVDVELPSPGVGDHTVTFESQLTGRILLHDERSSWGRLQELGFEPAAPSLGQSANRMLTTAMRHVHYGGSGHS